MTTLEAPPPLADTRKPCIHCSRPFTPGKWAKRLCWACRQHEDLRITYRAGGRTARSGCGHGNAARPLPDSPTTALPGSPEKVRVLEERAAAEVCLWHKDDATMGDDGRAT